MYEEGISVIVPFLNESESILTFCNKVDQYVASLKFKIQLVFVDDGSTDDSVEQLLMFRFKNVRSVKVIKLSKNFGSHAAIRAGIQKSDYSICTWLSCDLQEPLELLNLSYEKIVEEGYDAVYVEKKTVKVGVLNRAFSKIYSSLMRKYAVKNYSSDGISVIVFNKKIKEFLNCNVESNSSIHLQIIDAGFKSCSLSMDFNERSQGASKWTLSKKIKLFIDSFVAFSFMPIRMVSIVGFLVFIMGVVGGVITIVNKIINPSVPIGYSTLISILAVGFGITNILQ